MTKIVKILDGPFEQDGVVWLLCELTDGRGTYWHEEIYYDSVEEAYADFSELSCDGLELEEDYLDEDETYD
jgi:hypothetical protein